MEALKELAVFVASSRFESLPTDVVERAKWVLRDTIGVIIGGMAEPEVKALADYASQTAPGPVRLLGYSARTTSGWAALVEGTAGTTLEMDEGHAYARGHAAIHAIPPALALTLKAGSGGRELLAALVVGYEVAARAGVATRLRPAVHPFGAWGVLGAAAVDAWFKGFSADDVTGTLELAASYAITPSFETAYQGATVRNTYAGLVNRLGMLAADFYEIGFRGEKGGLQTTFGHIIGQQFDSSALSDGLGKRYEIMRGYFKPYSGCRYTHAAIDATLALRADPAFALDRLASIEVVTYDIAAHLSDPAPKTPLAGRFSTPYVVAATLIKGSAGPEIFTWEMLNDPGVLDLAARVTIRENPEYTAMTPAKRPAKVILHLQDGSQLEHAVFGSKGDPDQPMSAQELKDKFHLLCDPILGSVRADEAWYQLGQLEQLAQLDDLMQLLTPTAQN